MVRDCASGCAGYRLGEPHPDAVSLRPTDFLLLGPGLAIMVALRAARLPKGGLMAE